MNHSFDVNIAKKYGIEEAILLQHIYFWIEKNKANEKHFYNGTYWTYSTKKALAVLFPYLTPRKIDYALNNLIENGLIITGYFNEKPTDRTLWYALTKMGYCILQNCEMENTKLENDNNIYNNTNTNVENTNIEESIINNTKEKTKTTEENVYDYYYEQAIKFGYAKRKAEPNNITLTHIKKYLTSYSIDEIKKTIDRYYEVINDKTYFFNTYWSAEKFFKQGNTFNDFLEEGSKWINYKLFKEKQKSYNPYKREEISRETKYPEIDDRGYIY